MRLVISDVVDDQSPVLPFSGNKAHSNIFPFPNISPKDMGERKKE